MEERLRNTRTAAGFVLKSCETAHTSRTKHRIRAGAFSKAVPTGPQHEEVPSRARQVPHRSTTIFCNNFLGALPLTATRGRRIHVSVYWRHQHVLSGYNHLYSRKDRRSSEHETCVEWHSKMLDVIGDMICHTFPDIWHWWRLITSYCSCCWNVSEMFTSLFYLESSKGDLCWQTCEVTVHLMAKFDLYFTLGFSNIYLREPMEEQHGAL